MRYMYSNLVVFLCETFQNITIISVHGFHSFYVPILRVIIYFTYSLIYVFIVDMIVFKFVSQKILFNDCNNYSHH